MTKDEALKLALEALMHTPTLSPAVEELCDDAIDAIEQALAAPVQEPVGTLNIWFYKGHGNYDFDYWGSLGEGTYTVHVAKSEAPSHNSTCNETLRAQGKPYPRTCKKCGLGPCIGKPKSDTTPPAAPVQYELSPTDIYDFAGWLTTRNGVMKVGSSCEAGPMAEAVGEYLKTFPDRFTAAQRQWVGLNEDEIDKLKHLNDWTASWSHTAFAHAISHLLKIKNA